MKTFREFILEAEIKWNTGTLKGSKKSPSDTAKQKKANLERGARQKPSPEVFTRLTKIKRGISGADTLAKDTDPKPETTATRMQRTGKMRKNTGYATFRDTPTSSVGTESGVDRTGVHDLRQGGRRTGSATAPGEVVAGRHGKVTGGAGTRISRSGGTVGRKG
jgi:hypothetical protein